MNELEHFKNKQYIIWDWNGTLLDDLDYTWSIGNQLLKNNAKPAVSKEFYLENFCFPVSEYYRKLGFDVDNKSYFKQICEEFVGLYMLGVQNCKLNPNMLAIIKKLKADNISQSILSASEQGVLDKMLAMQNLKGTFEYVYGLSDKSATCKRKRGEQLISNIKNVDKSKILIVGDTIHDLEVGKDNGVDVLLVSHGHNSLKRLQECHDKILTFQ